MKTKRFFLFGLPVLLLALGLVLAGCGGDDDGDGGGGLNLPGITEETTGRATVTGSGITVSGAGMPQTLAEVTDDGTGVKFSITGGKFSFTLPQSPTNPQVLSNNYNLLYTLFGDSQATDYSVTPSDATFVMVDWFRWDTNNHIGRVAYETDKKTYMYSSEITYVYVSKDVTLSRAAGEEKDEDEDGTYTFRWGAVNLALKAGWNLVQKDSHETASGSTYTETITVKIADKDVPWMFSDEH